MEYRVVEYFTDMEDNGHVYHTGDIFPREGLEVSKSRIKVLSTTANKRGTVLIKAVPGKEETPEKVSPKPKEAPEKSKGGETPIKKSKPKKSTGKIQE